MELYNITDDNGERTDLANETTAKRDELLDDLLAWFKSSGALMTTRPNPACNPGALAAPKDKKERKNEKKK